MDFHQDDFIFHTIFGVGRVSNVKAFEGQPADRLTISDLAEVTVLFNNQEAKTFTRYLLERSYVPVHPEGFRAYAYLNPAGMTDKITKEPVEVILMVLQDFPNFLAKTEDLKEYLEPYVDNIKTWWEKTQELLKEDPRIDTSRTKFREYGIKSTSQSPAETKFRAFLRNKAFETPAKVYDLARDTLELIQKGHALEQENREILENFLRGVPRAERFSISDRIDALLRLREAGWLDEQETHAQFEKLLPSFKLYQLDEYAGNRLRNYLLSKPLDPSTLEMLASGICGFADMVDNIKEWALRRGDTALIHRILVIAFTENIPPELPGERYKWLAARLNACSQLARAVSLKHPIWLEVLGNLQTMLAGVAKQDLVDKASYLFGPLAVFASQVDLGLKETDQASRDALLQALVQPTFPIQFLLGVMDAFQKYKGADLLYKEMETRLWENGEAFGFEFIRDLYKGGTYERAKAMAALALKLDNHLVREKTGQELCAMLKMSHQNDLPSLIPIFNQFAGLPGTWSWSRNLDTLREQAYYDLMVKELTVDSGNRPLLKAVSKYVDLRSQEMKKTQDASVSQLEKAQSQIVRLENQLLENEAVLKELRSGFGNDTSDVRFDERTRILKELVDALADFERISIANPDQLNGIQPVLTRLNNLLTNQLVIPIEKIGSQVPFNPQKHRMVDPIHVDIDETVLVIERGFVIRDSKGKLRLLKPALVKK